MKLIFAKKYILFIAIFYSTVLNAAGDNVFELSDRLRQAIINKDTDYLKTLDPGGEVVITENIKYLYDANIIKKINPAKRSIRDILTNKSVRTFISNYRFSGSDVYTVYWAIPGDDGRIIFDYSNWLINIAACEISWNENSGFELHRTLCFSESGGPFE